MRKTPKWEVWCIDDDQPNTFLKDCSSRTDFVIVTPTSTMACLTSFRNLLCLTLFAVALATALSEQCYPAYIYRFRGSYEYKNVTTTVDCSSQKCKTVIVRSCSIIQKKVPYKVNRTVKVPHGKICKYMKVYDKHRWVWKKVCKTKFIFKRSSKTSFRRVDEENCRNLRRKKCKLVLATCVKIKVYGFEVLRSHFTCGSTPSPGHHPITKLGRGFLHKVIDGKRTILYKWIKQSMADSCWISPLFSLCSYEASVLLTVAEQPLFLKENKPNFIAILMLRLRDLLHGHSSCNHLAVVVDISYSHCLPRSIKVTCRIPSKC